MKKDVSTKPGEVGLLEQAFRLESLYRKHKGKLFILLAFIALFFIAKAIWQGMEDAKLDTANEALLTLQEDVNNTEALATLKANNPKLFELFSLSEAVKNEDIEVLKTLSSSKNELIADISSYTASVLEKSPIDSTYFSGLSQLQNAYLKIEAGEIDRAKEILELIPESSPLYEQALRLQHLTIKGIK